MTPFLCETCGVQYAPSQTPPSCCPICQDERQYVGRNGQRWTTIEELKAGGRRNEFREVEPDLHAVETTPSFAIGQRAVLVRTPAGNLLWESVSLADAETYAALRELGVVQAIAVSHPHFFSAMVELARAFDAPIWLHAEHREWVARPDDLIRYWDGDEAEPLPGSGLKLVRTGGHFSGMTGLLWPAGAEGRGAFLGGDMPQVAPDRGWVSFMYSYPNMIPLSAAEVRGVVARLDRYDFDRLYGSWPDRRVESDAKGAIHRSAERYVRHLG